jgi:hypothetical protein
MSPDSQIAALTVQVAWLTEQLQPQHRAVVPTKLVMTMPELASRWGGLKRGGGVRWIHTEVKSPRRNEPQVQNSSPDFQLHRHPCSLRLGAIEVKSNFFPA